MVLKMTAATPSNLIDMAALQLSANPQLASPFFTSFPAEIRNRIYLEIWKLASIRQHIVRTDPSEPGPTRWGHLPCITTLDVEDMRMDLYMAVDRNDLDRRLWVRRLKSQWCLHWPCEEQGQDYDTLVSGRHPVAVLERPASTGDQEDDHQAVDHDDGASPVAVQRPRDGYLDILTTCKRMYLETLPSLYTNTTFIFTDTRTAAAFLARYGTHFPLRSLELCLRIPTIITELYYPRSPHGGILDDEGPPAIFAGQSRPALTAQHNPWQHLCDALAVLPDLQNVRIWLDSGDLRPWHKRVSEARFLARLRDVQVPKKRRFVVGLPELPERRGPDSQALEGHYLEGQRLESLPFVVERGRRPNNWGIHLTSMALGPDGRAG
ncbi:hypothetical protein VTJ49DRAFT_7161 [Mycothermus thermophilus]|uniref:DUF7730 domain-containing protein n=1 Tax=Humicola insolens TaxID=85995 RepID=A0ABR3VHR5_HUMIN